MFAGLFDSVPEWATKNETSGPGLGTIVVLLALILLALIAVIVLLVVLVRRKRARQQQDEAVDERPYFMRW